MYACIPHPLCWDHYHSYIDVYKTILTIINYLGMTNDTQLYMKFVYKNVEIVFIR